MSKEKEIKKVEEVRNHKLDAAVRLLKEKLTQAGIEAEGKIITIKDNQVIVK